MKLTNSETPAATNYNPQRAEKLTKPKVPGVDLGKSPSRPQTIEVPGTDASAGPGAYDTGKKFGADVKTFTIGMKRPKKVCEPNPGAGTYEPQRAEVLTKPKTPAVDMGKSPSRPISFAKPGT